jgi:hypothetical protein
VPVDGGYHRLAQRPGRHVDAGRTEPRPRFGERAFALGEVGPRTERGRSPGQHHHADGVVVIEPHVDIGQFLAHAVTDRIALIGSVQRDGRHTGVDVGLQRSVTGQIRTGGQRLCLQFARLARHAPAPASPVSSP